MPQHSTTSTPAIAYSYIRFSTPEQLRGDSLRRQTEAAAQWCGANNITLDTSLTLHDLGKSAYLGAHRQNPDRNALAAFLKLVETGKIVRSVGVNGPAGDFWALERDLAGKLGDTMRTALPAAFEHAALLPAKPRPPKVAASTAVTYGRGLAAADAGKKAEARALLGKVVEEAPGFTLAKQDLNALLAP